MNKLPIQKRVQIINLLVEGCSIRAITRICDVSKNTVARLLVDVGFACQKFHDETVMNVACSRLQCDEIWAFIHSKEKNTTPEQKEIGGGDVWTWTGIDADSKLVISWFVGDRSLHAGQKFMFDIAKRVNSRMQITTDGLPAYLEAVYSAFKLDVDFAQLIKYYGATIEGETQTERKYSPNVCTGSRKKIVSGSPDEQHVSTSYVERQNLTMRMHMRRFTRLTNAFSKKIENHCHAIALHFVYYNFCKVHKTLRVTPAMEAKLMKRVMTIEDIVRLTDR